MKKLTIDLEEEVPAGIKDVHLWRFWNAIPDKPEELTWEAARGLVLLHSTSRQVGNKIGLFLWFGRMQVKWATALNLGVPLVMEIVEIRGMLQAGIHSDHGSYLS